ncbi:MAG TPA: cytochrome c [Pirellulales bacterium]|jgi:hypothetical protein
MKFTRIIAVGLAFGLTAAMLAVAADQSASGPKRAAPPTQWESRVTDTFFGDARTALSGERPAGLSLTASSKKAGGTGSGAATGEAGGDKAGGGDWSKQISADTLQDEVKTLAPSLAEAVKNQQGWSAGAKKARLTLSELAALFAIMNEYDGDVKWKAQAAAARDLFAKAGYNCKAATDQTFRGAKTCSDDLQNLLRGETIPAPANVDPKTDWSKVSNLAPLMTRLELAQRDRISAAMANAGDFKKNAAQLAHESELITAFAEVISRPGMENAEDEKFRGYAQALQKSAAEVRQAVSAGNYDAARTAAGTMSKACANCHGDFR